jgi:translocation and assembly module TamA
MSWRGSRLGATRLLCAAAALGVVPAFAGAQPAPAPAPQPAPAPPDAAELDPNAPLDPIPGLGVDWPQLDARGTVQTAEPTSATAPRSRTPHAIAAGTGTVRYTIEVEGLSSIGNADELGRQFRRQSALEAERKDPANAAQIGRRASADADLLT